MSLIMSETDRLIKFPTSSIAFSTLSIATPIFSYDIQPDAAALIAKQRLVGVPIGHVSKACSHGILSSSLSTPPLLKTGLTCQEKTIENKVKNKRSVFKIFFIRD